MYINYTKRIKLNIKNSHSYKCTLIVYVLNNKYLLVNIEYINLPNLHFPKKYVDFF